MDAGCRPARSRIGVSPGIDLVQEQKVGDASVLELLQDDLQRRDCASIGLGHDHRHVARR